MNKLTQIMMIALAAVWALSAQNSTPISPAPTPPATTPPAKPVEKPATTGTTPSEAVKPVTPATDAKPISPASETKPTTDVKPVTDPTKPITPPVKKDEAELDADTKRLIEEAKQKILREKAEKEAADKKAAEEAQRKKEEEKTFFGNLLSNSKLYTGVTGGLGISLNNVHSLGYGFGMTVDYLAFKHYGLHFAAATGQYSAKNAKFTSGNTTLVIPDKGTFGFLSLDFAVVYAFPQFWGMESAAGLGVSVYRLTGGNYNFNTLIAPMAMASVYYTLFSRLQAGIILHMNLPTAKKMQASGTDYELDSSAGLTTMRLELALRYSWF